MYLNNDRFMRNRSKAVSPGDIWGERAFEDPATGRKGLLGEVPGHSVGIRRRGEPSMPEGRRFFHFFLKGIPQAFYIRVCS